MGGEGGGERGRAREGRGEDGEEEKGRKIQGSGDGRMGRGTWEWERTPRNGWGVLASARRLARGTAFGKILETR